MTKVICMGQIFLALSGHKNNDFYHMSGIGLAISELIEDSKEFILNHRDYQPYESLKIYTRWEEQKTA